jgi:hypothetical protein
MSIETAARVFAALSKEPHLEPLHVSGGEAGLRLGLLEEVIRLAVSSGLRVSYVQTNGFWCADAAEARRVLRRLKDCGLEGLYVSVSMFHSEYVPLERSRICVEVAREVFGEANVTLWSPGRVDLCGTLLRMPGGGRRTFEEFERWAAGPDGAGASEVLRAALADLVPRGRIIETMPGLFKPRTPEELEGETCMDELLSTKSSGTTFHYHIDHHGDLIMGCCVGMAPATVEELHPRVTADSHPVFWRVCTGGPVELMRMAEPFGYRPRPGGYLGKCDLCFDVRRHLVATGRFPELRPRSIYSA